MPRKGAQLWIWLNMNAEGVRSATEVASVATMVVPAAVVVLMAPAVPSAVGEEVRP
jgi:hypothetical protein